MYMYVYIYYNMSDNGRTLLHQRRTFLQIVFQQDILKNMVPNIPA